MKQYGICAFCGRPKDCTHHLISGKGLRKLADEDSLTIEVCHEHHNMAIKPEDKIHGNPRAEDLSKMYGEALFIIGSLSNQLEKLTGISADEYVDEAIEQFRKSYGVSYL